MLNRLNILILNTSIPFFLQISNEQSEDLNETTDTPVEENVKEQHSEKAPISTSRPRKKVKTGLRAISELRPLHDSINSTSTPEDDNFDIFGRSVAVPLQNLSAERALIAQARIQNMLSELGIEELRCANSRSTSNVSQNYIV